MSVVVLGSSGQVARHLRALLPRALFWGRTTLDVADARALERAILDAAPRVVVNAAAYTAVDNAETHAAAAWRVNAEAPAAAARAAEALGIPMVQISTDYVFDGEAHTPYRPDAPARPLNVYGRSKLAGELAVASLCSRHWILRTSWVFSETGSNFVRSMLRRGASGETLRVVHDQIGRPTYAGHLAEVMALLVSRVHAPAGVPAETDTSAAGTSSANGAGGRAPTATPPLPWGTYHAAGGPVVSWYEFACKVFDRAVALGVLEHPPRLEPIATRYYPTAAARPLRAVLDPSPEIAGIGHGSFDWPAGLDQTLVRIRELELGP